MAMVTASILGLDLVFNRLSDIKPVVHTTKRTGLLRACYLFTGMLCLLCVSQGHAANAVYQSQEQFLLRTFGAHPPDSDTLWVVDEVEEAARIILGHRFGQLRVRYWRRDDRSAWILEEIGKVKPITFGVVIENDHIADISVMTYRESRGGEVRLPFFTRQFQGLSLLVEQLGWPDKRSSYRLSNTVDGISGATLSVRAMTRVAQLALYFHGLLVVEDA